MPRSVSEVFRSAAFGEETDEVFVVLITISHETLAEPIRVCSDYKPGNASTISQGREFIFFPFSFEFPADTDDALPQVTLQIDNVSTQITEAIRLIDTAPKVEVEVVVASQPDVLEAGPMLFQFANVEVNSLVITGTLGYQPILNEPYPAWSFTPAVSPSLF